MEGVVIDTNVFVAAGFNAKSASARILAAIRERRFRLVWNEQTRRETEFVLRRIPPLRWDKFAELFRPEGEFTHSVDPHDFAFIEDQDDRKFAALGAAAKVPLVTNDHHLLAHRNLIGFDVLTPSALLTRAGERPSSSSDHGSSVSRDRFVSDETVSAAALLMPSITTLDKLTQVALALPAHQGWLVNFSVVEDSRWGDLIAVHIVRGIPFGETTLPSEALV